MPRCPIMAQMQAWKRLRHWSMASSMTLCSTQVHTPIRCCLKSFTSCAFWLVDSLLNYAADFVFNCFAVTATRRPQIWRYECMAVGVSELLCTASLQTNIAALHRTRRDPSVSIYGVVNSQFVASLRGRVSLSPSQPHFLQSVCALGCVHIGL